MKLTYYGTAAAEGWPALFCRCDNCLRAAAAGGRNIRTRSQAAVDDSLLIDLPPDTYYHFIAYGLDLTRYAHLLITHPHHDHLNFFELWCRSVGVAAVLRDGVPLLTVYGSAETCEQLERENESDPSRVCFREIPSFEPTVIGEHSVIPLPAAHCPGARIHAISRGGRSMLYAHDTGLFPEESIDYIARNGLRFDLVSLDCTYVLRQSSDHHMGVDACRTMRDRLIGIGAASAETLFVLNHFSHNGGDTYDELTARLNGEFTVAYDGLTLEF